MTLDRGTILSMVLAMNFTDSQTIIGAGRAAHRLSMSRLVSVVVLMAGLGIALLADTQPTLAQTQDQPPQGESQRFQDWMLRCQPASQSRPKTCVLTQSLVSNEDGRKVLQITVGRFGEEQLLGAVIAVPIGVRLPPGLSFWVDDSEARRIRFERCDPGSCQAQLKVNDELLKSLQAGLIGHVTFQNGIGQPITINFSLKGFTAAFKALP